MRKKSLSTALLALLTASAYAQGGDGIAGITEATSMVTSYFYPLVQLIYAIGARDGTHRRDTCVPEVFVGRPRYVEDRSQLVRRLHLPDSRGNRPRIVLLLMEYGMNKGVGRSVEFRGLTSQYLFLFAAGMLASLLLTMVLYMAGADRTLCILVALVCMSLVVWGTFRMNRRYGPHGLMKRLAARRHPRRIIHRRSIRHLIVKRN